MDVIDYLHKRGLTYKRVRRASGLVAIMNCPFCGDKENKFAVSLVDGAFNCLHLNKCGVKGSFYELQKLFGDTPVRLNEEYRINTTPKTYTKPSKKNIRKINDAGVTFLHNRKISDETIKKLKICTTADGAAIAIPYLFDGELVNIKYRSIKEKKFWHEAGCELKLYNIDNCNDEEWLIILEGELDVMAACEYGISAVSVPNGADNLDWIETCYGWLNGFDKILIGLDDDAAGNKNILKIADRLGRWRSYRLILPKKDMNDCLIAGISKDKIFDCILNAEGLGYNKIRSAIEFINDVIEYNKNSERRYGISIGFSGLNKILRGWREQELTIWSGRNSSGKTNFLNEIILDLIEKKQKCFLVSLEMSPHKILTWLTLMDSGIQDIEQRHITETLNKLGFNLYLADIYDKINSDILLDMMIYTYKRYGVKHYFIDNLIGIEFNYKYELEEQKNFVTRLRNFAREHGCHVHLVAHPRKGLRDTDKPDKVDISGSYNITNLADNLLILYRFTEEEKEKSAEKNKSLPDAILFVKKNREWGDEKSIRLNFTSESKRFSEVYYGG